MKVILDSDEPLDDALRVIGALYNVTVVASPETPEEPQLPPPTAPDDYQDAAQSAQSPAADPGLTANSSGADEVAGDAVATSTDRPGRNRRRGSRPATDSTDNAEVRSWARRNGFTISDRGRIPAPVLSAYRIARDA